MEKNDVIEYCRNDFQSASFIVFEDMRKRGRLCDLTIKIQGRSLAAHQVIVAAAIPYFESAFGSEEIGQKEIAVENLDAASLESLIDFAYTGRVSISSENVKSLLSAARFLQLKEVEDACVSFLSGKRKSDNVVQGSTLPYFSDDPEVVKSYNLAIRKNFQKLSKRDDFLYLPYSCIKEIISGDNLNVSGEEIVFEALMKWVRGKTSLASPFERQDRLPDLLCEIRLTSLPIKFLVEQVESEDLVMSSKPCRDLVRQAKYYHMMQEKESTLSSNLKMQLRNHLKKDILAVCSCGTCGYLVYHFNFVSEDWHCLSVNHKSDLLEGVEAVNEKLYIFCNRRILIFDVKTRKWELLNHYKETAAAFVAHESIIYGFVICDPRGNYCNSKKIIRFDTVKRTFLEDIEMPSLGFRPAAAPLGEDIYVTGGGGKDVKKFTPSTGKWNYVSSMHFSRQGHFCTSVNEKIYVFGGTTGDECSEVYNPRTNQWNPVSWGNAQKIISVVSDHKCIYVHRESGVDIYDTKNHYWVSKESSRPAGFRYAVSIPFADIQTNPVSTPGGVLNQIAMNYP